MARLDDSPRLTAVQLRELFLVGLALLRERDRTKLRRKGNSIFSALYHGTVISRQDYRGLAKNAELMTALRRWIQTEESVKAFSKSSVERLAGESDKYLLALISPPEEFVKTKIYGAYGYPIVITDAGIDYAHRIAAPYPLLTPETFAFGWSMVVSNARGMGARLQQGQKSVNEGVMPNSRRSFTDTRANISEADFEW